MPRVGPGGDNVTGDRYTLDLGVEPDLGNLLQNLQVANDYLDQAEQRFRTISDVVGTTTQRLAQATRQTQMLAAETQRLQNSYAQIASSTMGVANMGMMGGMGGGMPMGGMAGGYGGGFMPGQMSFQGMGSPGGGNIIQTMPSRVVDENAGGFQGGQSTVAPARMPRMRFTELEQGKEFLIGGRDGGGGIFGSRTNGGGTISRWIGQMKAGYKGYGNITPQYLPSPPEGIGLTPAAPEGALGELPVAPSLGLLGKAAGFAKAATGVGAALYGANKIYDVWAGQQAASRQLAGITGGEAGIAGMLGNNGVPGTLELGLRGKVMSLLNPGVDYGEIQQRTLGAGYVQGRGYEQARDYLFEAYKRGLGTTIDQIDLYMEAVDKSGASTQSLVTSMDQLRFVASNTNVSIDALYNNMKNQVETLTGMGMSGGAAVAQATQGATAFANAPYGTLDPNLRQAGGYGISNPFVQARVAGNLGIPIGGMAPYLAQHPGTNINVQVEKVARDVLINTLGFQPGWTIQQFDDYIYSRGWGALPDGTSILSTYVEQLGIVPDGFDASDYQSLKRWIWSTLNEQPMKSQNDAAKQSMRGRSLMGGLVSDGSFLPASQLSQEQQGFLGTKGKNPASQYVTDVLGINPFEDNMLDYGLLTTHFSLKGATSSPVLEKILAGGGTQKNTYVQTEDGRIIRLDDWMRTAPDWQGALESGRVKIAHPDQDALNKIGGRTRGIERTDIANFMDWQTTQQEMVAPVPTEEEDKAWSMGSSRSTGEAGSVNMTDSTIAKFAKAVGDAVGDAVGQ